MMTIRHIERLFSDQQYRRLFRDLIAGRPEGTFALESRLARPMTVAAMGVIRLDELSQSYAGLYRKLLGVVLTGQQVDGGWDDPMTTALCVRALLCGGGQGAAVEQGLRYLASLQQSNGIWPKEPIRRMPSDSFASAFILMQLGDREIFRRAVQLDDALNWFAANSRNLDPEARRLWSHVAVRCRANAVAHLWTTSRPAA